MRACEEDLIFNPKTGQCDWPMNVDCKPTASNKKKYKKTTTPSKKKLKLLITSTAAAVSVEADEDEESGDKTAAAAASAVATISSDTICSEDDYGYIPHPKDCRKYIYCQEGTSKVFSCQGGLLWKQSDENCVWPLDSDCTS